MELGLPAAPVEQIRKVVKELSDLYVVWFWRFLVWFQKEQGSSFQFSFLRQ